MKAPFPWFGPRADDWLRKLGAQDAIKEEVLSVAPQPDKP